MKIAIISDLHIGYERFEEDSYRQAADALNKAAELADAILIAGDVFDKRSPRPDIIAKAVNLFRDLSRKKWSAKVTDFQNAGGRKPYTDVPVLAIPGTHERVAEGKENVLGLLGLAGLLVDISESTATVELDGDRVAVFGLGGVSEERVREVLEVLAPKPVPKTFSIFMMHQSVYEVLPYGENIIRFDELPDGFDLYINGHIHSRYEGMVHGKKFLIPGSTVLTQLKEAEQERKGFILFDTKTGSHKFIEIDSRPFIFRKIKFDNADAARVNEEVSKTIEMAISGKSEKPIVKIVLEGTLARGVRGTDLSLRLLYNKYSDSALLDIASEIQNPDINKEIEDLRKNKIEGTSVREMGMRIFLSRLIENGFDKKVGPEKLFDVLSKDGSKDKIVKEALELVEGSDRADA
jgi:DNA repair exonuclease SbcCD nuclease subunit